MPWKAGQSGNPAGRTKGSKNKIRGRSLLLQIREAIKQPDYHPLIELAKMAADEETEQKLRQDCQKELCKYIEPQLKAVEHTGPEGDDLRIVVTISPDADN